MIMNKRIISEIMRNCDKIFQNEIFFKKNFGIKVRTPLDTYAKLV